MQPDLNARIYGWNRDHIKKHYEMEINVPTGAAYFAVSERGCFSTKWDRTEPASRVCCKF